MWIYNTLKEKEEGAPPWRRRLARSADNEEEPPKAEDESYRGPRNRVPRLPPGLKLNTVWSACITRSFTRSYSSSRSTSLCKKQRERAESEDKKAYWERERERVEAKERGLRIEQKEFISLLPRAKKRREGRAKCLKGEKPLVGLMTLQLSILWVPFL